MLTPDIIKSWCEPHLELVIKEREYLHQNPELSYQEYKTTQYIVDELSNLNIRVERLLDTGCIGIIEGDIPSDRTIALRADIDALPIQEEGDAKKDFFSTIPGVAHCCGHDAHTANLLGTARVLMEHVDQLEGRVILVFQPGEETLPGGGRLLCETGWLQKQNIQHIFGLHTSPSHDVGIIASRKGELMAAPDEFTIRIVGLGGHAARPHEAVDPIVIASECILSLQTIVSRNVDPTEKAVLTVGRVEGGSAHNIIPEEVRLWGTIRTFSKETAQVIEQRMHELLQGLAKAHRAVIELDINKGYPAVINDNHSSEVLHETALALFGSEKVEEMERPIMAGEDFSFYQQEFPGAFYFVGSGSEATDSQHVWHHPKYNVDPSFFSSAMPMMVALAFGLNKHP
jgi:amidohydrolase